ncbi:hypothetical protein P170DRAFT_474328 [Aspergillus steynii IBT 23096]|uniref:CENP-V/GFA domain-containing protein n=1 Tax=Aspergillus steynii IBT 23096 TaxID=1392250 RepID=A0A2I2GD06_9EURO|nr:uncharacterized protein P170DRAFT_474328 [Aspergillus steynii IBT 23096]PLB50774.1 hypothetical protein P170DRAFT_474328 [Aspergillus steynii IBT 23096]
MPYTGHCNCESIRITLASQPENSVICHCASCKRAGGSVFSTNYFVGEEEISLEDAQGTLRIYDDTKTASGNVARRHFCSNCGSPIYTKTPSAPGKLYLKAALFDRISSPKLAVFKERQPEWATLAGPEGEI